MVFLSLLRANRLPRHRKGKTPGTDRFWKTIQLKRMTWRFHNRIRNVYSVAVIAAMRAMKFSFLGRRNKKLYHNELWQHRINAGSLEHGLTYKQFMAGLAESHICLDRKVLAELAMYEPRTFKSLAEIAKKRHLEQGICLDEVKPPEGVVTRGMLNEPVVPGNKKLYRY